MTAQKRRQNNDLDSMIINNLDYNNMANNLSPYDHSHYHFNYLFKNESKGSNKLSFNNA